MKWINQYFIEADKTFHANIDIGPDTIKNFIKINPFQSLKSSSFLSCLF